MHPTDTANVPIHTRPFLREQDWWRTRNLIIETHALVGPEFNWEFRHWDGNRFHDLDHEFRVEKYGNFRIWETADERLAGVAHFDGDELCMQIHPDYRSRIEEEMVAWGEEYIAAQKPAGERNLYITVYEYDHPRHVLLAKRGFEKLSSGWITRWMRLTGQPLVQPNLADGYIMRTTHSPEDRAEFLADCKCMADLLNAAFNRTFHMPEDYECFATRSPGFLRYLNLVAVAPDGSFAAHAAVNYDQANRFALFEPVCTHPAHRKKGLAKALMLEGIIRARELGATHIEVSTGDMDAANALYDSIGFSEYYKAYTWKKSW